MMRLGETSEMLADLRKNAANIWNSGNNEYPADQNDRFFLLSRVSRYTFSRQYWQRIYMEDIAPTFDNEFVDCILRIPAEWRVGHRFYQQFLAKLEPTMMQIPYQRTLLPPETPLRFWAQGEKSEQQREKLYRDIWLATGGRVFIPYRRYFTNYDEWLRCDPLWMKLTDDLLLDQQSLLCTRFVDRRFVTSLVDEHRSGSAAMHQKIIQLMNLELFLREFFK